MVDMTRSTRLLRWASGLAIWFWAYLRCGLLTLFVLVWFISRVGCLSCGLSVRRCACLVVYLSICVLVLWFICLSVYMSLPLSIWLYAFFRLNLSYCLPFHFRFTIFPVLSHFHCLPFLSSFPPLLCLFIFDPLSSDGFSLLFILLFSSFLFF